MLLTHHTCTTVCVMILVLPLIQTRSFLLKEEIYIPPIVSWMFMQSDWPSVLIYVIFIYDGDCHIGDSQVQHDPVIFFLFLFSYKVTNDIKSIA